MALDELPEVMTLAEAARALRIGRSAAYELARQWKLSGGKRGIPVVTVGRQFRVLRSALVELLDPNRLAS